MMLRSLTKNVSVSSRLLTQRWYSTHIPQIEKKITLLDIAKKHKEGTPLTMVTAYDYTSAYFVDKASVDVILVGDSLGMVMLGRDNTAEVTMDEMLHHCKAVSRGTKRAFVVGDLPFGSFEVSSTDAVRNAIRLVKEGLVSAVKLEGGRVRASTVKAIVDAGIPVVGHIGLTPQTAGSSGGFRVQGKSAQAAATIFEDALALQDAGCSALVLEVVPELLGQAITKGISIPTFGIGAGRFTSGQVLVYHDMLGMYPNFAPKFCKQYTNVGEEITKGLTAFKQEVEGRQFPAPANTFSMKTDEWLKAHELISAAHPNKEGVDSAVASALAHVKASLEVQSLKAKESEKSVVNEKVAEKSTTVEKSLEKATTTAKPSEKSTNNEKATNAKPTIIEIIPPTPTITTKQSTQYTYPLPPLTPLTPPTTRIRDYSENFVNFTNFDIYYNSYNEEMDRISLDSGKTSSSSQKRKMNA